MNALSLKRNFSWTVAGQVVYASSQWGILTLLARMGSSVIVGQYALALAIVGPIVAFLNLKLRAVQASDAVEEYSFRDYLGVRIVTSLVAVGVILVVSLIVAPPGDLRMAIILLGLAKSFESLSDIFYGFQQKYERMDLVAKSMIVKAAISLMAFSVAFAMTDRLTAGIVGLALAWLVTLLAIDIPFARRTASASRGDAPEGSTGILMPKFDRRIIGALVCLTIPLGLTVTLGTMTTNIPRYFIGHYLGDHDLGIYAMMTYPLVAGGLLVSALGQSATPKLAKAFQLDDLAAFQKLLVKLLVAGIGLGIAGIIIVLTVGKPIIRIVYGAEYDSYHIVLTWVMVNAAIGYTYVFLGTALTAMRKYRVQLPVHIVTIVVLSGLSLLFIPRWGLSGALLALTIASLAEAALYFLAVARFVRQIDRNPAGSSRLTVSDELRISSIGIDDD